MRKLLIVVDAPGPAEFILPALPHLTRSFSLSIVTVKESPTTILAAYAPNRIDDENEVAKTIDEEAPDAVLIGMSSLTNGPYVVRRAAEYAEGKKIPLFGFQDYWANHRWPQNRAILPFLKTLLVPDTLARHFLEEDEFDGAIEVVGNPAFDTLRTIDVAAERARLRKELSVSSTDFVVLYSGTGTAQSSEEDMITFRLLVDALRLITDFPIRIIARPHPRDEHPERYSEYAPDLSYVDTSGILMTETVLPVADVVVSMYSTNLIHACYLRIPAVSILLSNAGRKRLSLINLRDFPPNLTGATIGVYDNDPKQIAEIFRKLYSDPKHRGVIRQIQDVQMESFAFEHERAAEKVASAVVRLCGEIKNQDSRNSIAR